MTLINLVVVSSLLIIAEWIESQIEDLKKPTDIVVTSIKSDGSTWDVQLTPEVWQKHLLRGPWKSLFEDIWDTSMRAQAKREAMRLELISTTANFQQNCQNFIYDLRSFDTNKKSRERLETVRNRYYIGKPYFSDDVCDKILRFPEHSGTLQTVLEALEKKRVGSKICAAHDLSPIFESALGITWDKTRGKALID